MNANRLPTIFLSHGAPTIALESTSASLFLQELGSKLPRPKAILTISAHWTTARPQFSLSVNPTTIHDFGGFPPALYEMQYTAPGAPELSLRAAELLNQAGIECTTVPERGYDHGVWIPLQLMYPAANIPIAQLSCQPAASPAAHFKIGQALKYLRDEGVLIIASGTAVHNLGTIGMYAEPPAWAVKFEQWLHDEVLSGDAANLLQYRTLVPEGKIAHPTTEHFQPIFVALGAASNNDKQFRGSVLHRSWAYGSLSMAAYAFDNI